MIYLICQNWSNTSNNHAGIKYLCLQLEKRYPDTYKTFVIPDFYSGISKNRVVRKILSYKVKWKLRCELNSIYKQLSLILKEGDRVFLLEYMEKLFPQLLLSKKLKSKFPNIPIYGMVHLVPQKIENSFNLNDFNKWVSNIDYIVTLGSSLSKYFISKGVDINKVITTFHYVDDYYFYKTPIRNHKIPQVIAMGNQVRNLELLRKVVDENQNVRFVICQGVIDMSSLFRSYKNVTLIPFVAESELRKYMMESDISINIMQDTIGSNVIVTSLAMGLAMLCSDVGSIRDYCDENNTIFCNNDSDFSNALIKLFNDRILLSNMQQSSANKALQFNIEKFHAFIMTL